MKRTSERPPGRPAKAKTPAASKTGKAGQAKGPARSKPKEAPPAEGGIRLHVMLARAGIASRREAERLIAAGEIQVNGKVVREPGVHVREGVDHVRVEGRLVRGTTPLRHYAYHKPVGCVSTLRDPEGRFSIGDVCEALGVKGLFPVGRLDYNSSGLMILTNDGAMAEGLTHPRYHVEKRYSVKVKPRPSRDAIEELREGVRIGRALTAPAWVREQRHADGKSWIDVRIAEGRNQQIRRMFEAIGCRVEKLRRDAIGPLRLSGLSVGHARALAAHEIAALRAAIHDAKQAAD